MDILADSPLIPASFFWILCLRPTRHPRQVPLLLCHSGLCFVVYDDAVHGFLFLFVCPCPNRASGKGEAYSLPAFFLSLFLAFGSCPASLSVVHGTWWLRVSCCGRSLLVHSSGVTFCLSRHLLLFVLVCCLDAFPLPHEDCTAFFCFALLQCVFDALWWADTVTRWLTALFI